MRLYWDANTFIRMVEATDIVSSKLNDLLEPAVAVRLQTVTSELTLAEVLVEPLRTADQLRIDAYETLLTRHDAIEILPVSRGILRRAAHIRAKNGSTKLPDAIHVATAELAGCNILLSADRRLSVRAGLQLLAPSPSSIDALFNEFS